MEILMFVARYLALLCFSKSVAGSILRRADRANGANFLMRAFQRSAVVGNYLYIDGGEVSYMSGSPPKQIVRPQNNTLSVDLRTSWTNNTVSINSINKTAPVLNNEYLWVNGDNTSFYMWGGYVSPLNNIAAPPPNDLWRFDSDGQGGGSWHDVPVPANFVRNTHGQSTFHNGVGYLLGGQISGLTSPYFNGLSEWNVPGLVSYDISSNTFTNTSSQGLGTQGGRDIDGELVFVPSFGSQGVLVALGGHASNLTGFDHVSIYDLSAKQWYSQATSGLIPGARVEACSVGVQGDNGTYEIFIYGGTIPGQTKSSTANIRDLDQIFVLSLPSFQWYQADYPPVNARFEHSCNVIGQRQMLIVGGASSKVSWDFNGNNTDPWTKGLNIFDMSAMAWSDGYNANAEAYVTSDMVNAGIQKNGKYPTTWNDPSVKALFTNGTITNSSSPGAPSSTPTPSPTPSSGLSGGAIAGIVIGVVLGVLIITGGAFLLFRRRRCHAVQPHREGDSTKTPENKVELYSGDDHAPYNPDGQKIGNEYQSQTYREPYTAEETELDANAVHSASQELPGSKIEQPRHELPGS